MLDWSLYKTPITNFTKNWIENLFYKLNLSSTGICHEGGNNSFAVIQCSNIGIKVYNYNPIKSALLFNNCKTALAAIYKNPHVQKISEINNSGYYSYNIQDFFEGKTMKDKLRENPPLNEVINIIRKLYLDVIIPLWSQGLIFKLGALKNTVVTNDNEVKVIDTDSMCYTLSEIENYPSKYKKRNLVRVLIKPKHAELVYESLLQLMLNTPGLNSDQTNNLKKNVDNLFLMLDPIYHDSIDKGYLKNSISCYYAFEKELIKLVEPL